MDVAENTNYVHDPAPEADRRVIEVDRKIANQMRVWELEQKRLVPQGLLSVGPQGLLQVAQGPIADCEVDSDPLAIHRSVVPELPEWLRDFLISILRSVYGTLPHPCRPFYQVLIHSREDNDGVGLTLGILQFFFMQSTTGLKLSLDRLDEFITQVRTQEHITPHTYLSVQDTIRLMVGCSSLVSMPNEVMIFFGLLRAFEDDPGRCEGIMLDCLDWALMRPYKALLDKLELAEGWVDWVVDAFEVPMGEYVGPEDDGFEEY